MTQSFRPRKKNRKITNVTIDNDKPVIDWKELKTNPFLQSLNIEMFSEDGYLAVKKDVIVKYSIDYIKAKLLHIIQPILDDCPSLCNRYFTRNNFNL
jgi:hypothetical protein